MTTNCCRILSRRLGTGARLIAVCILFHGGGTWLQAQVSADVTVTGDFARTVVRTHSYAEYVVAVENAKNGNLIEKNEVETQGEIKDKFYNGTLTLPEATNGQSFICLMTLVSDDGCEMAIDNAAPWLREYGQGHDISKGARPWPGVLVSGKTYKIEIHYSQVWFKPGINDHDGISVILCLLPMEFKVPGQGAEAETTVQQFPLSNTSPTILVREGQVTLNVAAESMMVTITGATLHDALSEIYPDGIAEPSAVTLILLGDEFDSNLQIGSLTHESEGAPTRWKPHPKLFRIPTMTATLPLRSGAQVLELRSSENASGNIGTAQIIVRAWKEFESGSSTETWHATAELGDATQPGSCMPIAFSMGALGRAEGWALVVGNTDFALETAPNGSWRLKGGSEGFLTLHQNRDTLQYELRGINASGETIVQALGANLPQIPIHLRPPPTIGVNLIDIGTVPVTAPELNVDTGGNGTLGTPIRPRVGQPDAAHQYHLNNVAWIEPHSNANGPGMPNLRVSIVQAAGANNQAMEVRWRLEIDYHRPFGGGDPDHNPPGQLIAPPRLNMDYILIPGDRTTMDATPELAGWTPPGWLPRPGKQANSANSQEAWTAWMPITQEWSVAAEPTWAREVGFGLFGGNARLIYQTRNNGGQPSRAQALEFRIGGKNPVDAICKQYIQDHDTEPGQGGFEHWYAYAVAKHETAFKNVAPTVRRGINPGGIFGALGEANLGRYFNHFWEGRPGGYMGAGFPVHNDDDNGDTDDSLSGNGRPPRDGIPDNTGGFGLFQVTRRQGQADFLIPRSSIWNWQASVAMGVAELRDKRVNFAATDVPDVVSRNYVSHAVPRVRNPDIVGDVMNSAATNGIITGGDRADNIAPNGFPSGQDYRKARFNSRDGYLILDTIRRYNGGQYCQFTNDEWSFCRWRPLAEPERRKSYVDMVFDEIEAVDVPQQFRP